MCIYSLFLFTQLLFVIKCLTKVSDGTIKSKDLLVKVLTRQ